MQGGAGVAPAEIIEFRPSVVHWISFHKIM
jgi:hypothetical protein